MREVPFANRSEMKRKAYRYKIVSSQSIEDVEKEVNACLEQLSYELYGSPFSFGDRYVQALVKTEESFTSPLQYTDESNISS
jgi:hypothetical protein